MNDEDTRKARWTDRAGLVCFVGMIGCSSTAVYLWGGLPWALLVGAAWFALSWIGFNEMRREGNIPEGCSWPGQPGPPPGHHPGGRRRNADAHLGAAERER